MATPSVTELVRREVENKFIIIYMDQTSPVRTHRVRDRLGSTAEEILSLIDCPLNQVFLNSNNAELLMKNRSLWKLIIWLNQITLFTVIREPNLDNKQIRLAI